MATKNDTSVAAACLTSAFLGVLSAESADLEVAERRSMAIGHGVIACPSAMRSSSTTVNCSPIECEGHGREYPYRASTAGMRADVRYHAGSTGDHKLLGF